MFGFKHTLNNFNHNEVTLQKSRLFGRLIQVNGVSNLPKIYPYLANRVDESIAEMVNLGKVDESMSKCRYPIMTILTRSYTGGISLPVAQTVRTIASRAMCVLFFGEKLCTRM